MTTRARLLFVVVASALACGAPACPVGPSSLVGADASVRILLTRVATGDVVTASVDDTVRTFVGATNTSVTIGFEAEPGDVAGAVVVGRASGARCANFVLTVEEGEVTELALDVETLPLCAPLPSDGGEPDAGEPDAGEPDAGEPDAGEPDAGEDAGTPDAGDVDAGVDAGPIDAGDVDAGDVDAGLDAGDVDAGLDAGDVDAGDVDAGFDAGDVDAGDVDAGDVDGGTPVRTFVSFTEDVRIGLCIVEPCHVITTVSADGTITYANQADEPLLGVVSALDLEALLVDVLDPSVDALFAGDDPLCGEPPPGALDTVVLNRVTDEGVIVDLSKDTSGCLSTVVLSLRLRMSLLRLAAFGIE